MAWGKGTHEGEKEGTSRGASVGTTGKSSNIRGSEAQTYQNHLEQIPGSRPQCLPFGKSGVEPKHLHF